MKHREWQEQRVCSESLVKLLWRFWDRSVMLSCGMYSFCFTCLGLPCCLSSHSGCLYEVSLTSVPPCCILLRSTPQCYVHLMHVSFREKCIHWTHHACSVLNEYGTFLFPVFWRPSSMIRWLSGKRLRDEVHWQRPVMKRYKCLCLTIPNPDWLWTSISWFDFVCFVASPT